MAVTDLTGTKWVINSTACTSGYGQFHIDFVYNENAGNSGFYIGYTFDPPRPVATANAIVTIPTLFNVQIGDVIEITDGQDVTNANLISWLESHATQITISDLTDTTWVFNDTVYLNTSLSYFINFNSNNTSYASISLTVGSSSSAMNYVDEQQYMTTVGIGAGGATPTINNWNNNAYKTIYITGGSDVEFLELIAWLMQNATLQVSGGSISLGTLPIAQMFLGSDEVSKVFLGEDLVYEKTPTPSGYEVTISFGESHYGYKDYIRIYDGTDDTGVLLYEDTTESATPTQTIICSSGNIYVTFGGPFVVFGTITPSSNITTEGYEDAVTEAWVLFNVAGDGTISIHVNYDE